MTRRHLLIASALLATTTTAAAAQDGILLRVGGQVGQVNRYLMVMNTFVLGGPMASMGGDTSQPMTRMTTWNTRTLTSIAGDTLTFTESVDSARMESPAMPQMAAMMGGVANSLRGRIVTTKMDGRAHIYSTESSGAGGGGGGGRGGRGMMGGGNNQPRQMYVLPAGPVRVGQTWTDSMTTPGNAAGEGASSFVAAFKLERVDGRGSSRVAVISIDGNTVMSTPGGTQRFTMTGQFQLDVTGGRLASTSITMNGRTQMGQGGEVPVRMVMEQSLVP